MGAALRRLLEQLDPALESLLPMQRHRRVLDDGYSMRARCLFWHGAMLHGSGGR